MSNPNLAGLVRGSVAVVGAAESDLGQMAPNTNPMDLMAQATMRALEDCGLTLKDVDGLFVGAMLILVLANNYLLLYVGWEGVGLASYLLIRPARG